MQISVVVPVYNVEKYIVQCLDSIRNQTFTEFECILIDDGSTDSSGTLCDKYVDLDKRFSVFHKKNGGLVSARKKGVEIAQGQYICFIDADDYVENTFLKIYASAIEHYYPDMIVNNYIEIFDSKGYVPYFLDGNLGLYEGKKLDRITSKLFFDEDIKSENMGAIIPSLCLKCIKKELLMFQYSNCDDSISVGEDLMISFPTILNCSTIYIVCEKGYFYRKNQSSIINSFKPENFNALFRLIKYLYAKLPNHQKQINHYALSRLCDTIVSAAKEYNYKEFSRLLNEKIDKKQLQEYTFFEIFKFSFKKQIFIFLVKLRLWIVLYFLIKLRLK